MELWRPPGYNLLISQSPSKKHSVKYVEVLFLDKSSWGHLCNGFLLYAHFIRCQFADYQYCYYHFEHYLWLVLLCSAPIHLVPFVCFLKWANPGLFFVYFRSFQTSTTIFTTNQCEKCPSSIWGWDSNPQPLKHELSPITTRPAPMNLSVG